MSKARYRIKWYATRTGAEGVGDPVFVTELIAQIWADLLNQENKGSGLIHIVEPVPIDEPPQKV